MRSIGNVERVPANTFFDDQHPGSFFASRLTAVFEKKYFRIIFWEKIRWGLSGMSKNCPLTLFWWSTPGSLFLQAWSRHFPPGIMVVICGSNPNDAVQSFHCLNSLTRISIAQLHVLYWTFTGYRYWHIAINVKNNILYLLMYRTISIKT